MLTRVHEGVFGDQAMRNLHFLIELELQKIATLDGESHETAQALATLRRMMDLEETLRTGLTSHGLLGDASDAA